jgi:tetratricopeptide (TPR) repeat protein
MKRRVDQRFLLKLLVSVLLLGVLAYLVHRIQDRRTASKLLEQAERATEHGQGHLALLWLDAYLTIFPHDLTALAQEGILFDSLARTPQDRQLALRILEQVLRQAPDRADVRRHYATIALELGQFADAEEHLGILLGTDPSDAELKRLMACCCHARGDYFEAASWMEKALGDAPHRLDLYLEYADLLRTRLQRPQQAAKVLDQMVAANTHSAAAYLARARLRRDNGALQEAARDAAQALQLAPEDPDTWLLTAKLAEATGHPDEARAALHRGLETHPEEARFHEALAALDVRCGRLQEAEVGLRRGLALHPEQTVLQEALADLLIDKGRYAEAGPLLARIRTKSSQPEVADYLEARLLAGKGKWLEATALLEEVRRHLADGPGLPAQIEVALSQCYEHFGDSRRQLDACRRAVALDSTSAGARLALAAALQASGESEEALAAYRQAVRLPEESASAWEALAETLLLRNLSLPVEKRDWSEARRVLKELENREPGSARAVRLRASLLAAQEEWQRANDVLRRGRQVHPTDVSLAVAQADLADRRGQPEAALRLLNEATHDLSDSVELRLARVRHWSQQPAAAAIPALAEIEHGLKKLPERDQAHLRWALAAAREQLGDLRGASRLYQVLADAQPQDLRSRLHLLDLARQRRDEPALARLRDQLRRLEGEGGGLWHYAEAVRLLLQATPAEPNRLAEATEQLDEAARRRPDWFRIPSLAAAIAERQRNWLRAIEQYLQALSLGEQQPEVFVRAAQLLAERHRYAEADRMLRKLETRGPLPRPVARLAADVALGNGDPERAVALARHAVSPETSDYRAFLWLGRFLDTIGQDREAEEVFRRAVQHSAQAPEVWVALIQHLAGHGQRDGADQALQQAQERLSKAQLPLVVAQAQESLGRWDQAEHSYVLAVAAQPDDFRTVQRIAQFYVQSEHGQRAKPYLYHLLGPRVAAPPETLTWARRELALVLAAEGPEDRVADAMALLERNRADVGDTVEDERARALVLATQPSRRQEAIHLLEASRQDLPLSEREQFQLAQLYDAANDAGKVRALLVPLLATHGNEARYVRFYADFLKRQGMHREAQRWLARLGNLAARASAPVEMKTINSLSPQVERRAKD